MTDEVKAKNTLSGSSPHMHVTPSIAASFETRNIGTTLEYQSTLNKDRISVNLRILPDHTSHTGRISWGQGMSRVELPDFETQRLATEITTQVERPFMLGTINRPPNSKVDPQSSDKVFYAFVTVSLTKL